MLTQSLSIREIVHEEIKKVLGARGVAVPPFKGDEALHAVGLDSLALAQLLLELEGRFGVDPFESLVSITDVRTIPDLIGAYDRAGAQAVPS